MTKRKGSTAAIASAYNEWTLAKWVRPYACFKGSIVCLGSDPAASAAEVRRRSRTVADRRLEPGALLPTNNELAAMAGAAMYTERRRALAGARPRSSIRSSAVRAAI